VSTDPERSLEALEGEIWPPPQEYPSRLVERCYRLRKVPIAELSAGDLRLLIGQGIGLEHLMPLAIELLRVDPYVEADLYPGDLLKNVQAVGEAYWEQHPEQRAEVWRLPDHGLNHGG
jgi:hypothetical protein